MNYKISRKTSDSKYLSIKALISEIHSDLLEIKLPAWRPGRYEIQNFAQYIRDLKVFSDNGDQLETSKTSKDSWQIRTGGNQKIEVQYEFYAEIENAGGSYVDQSFFYLNPINCLIYVEDRQEVDCSLAIDFEANDVIASGMPFTKNGTVSTFQAKSFHEIVDSPIMISDSIQHRFYKVQETEFHIWIKGNTEIQWSTVLKDFEAFTAKQIEVFGEFPEPEFHFMLWMMPNANYHGVEHFNSTMMTLGPVSQPFEEFYTDFLGLASHELFHTWNVKRIRPKELLPYDYSKENYFETCFVSEGLTTFYGDWMLHRSGVFSKEQYQKELETTLRRHFDHADQATESLLQSSYDLWLDGYKKGTPNRKVSVYHKGAVAALILNHIITTETQGNKSIDEVMRLLWLRYGSPLIGFSYEDYIAICEEVCGTKLDNYFDTVIAGNHSIWEPAKSAIEAMGFTLSKNAEGFTQLGLKEDSSS
ncbi:M61 family metallopeptidase [Jiulongibacter sp. NS-SX5]|uniref:M61 family metallopeptidase n=1 Tax=Jiulongibacter sp. NS-SX5 TaxID=3463854 RepID=UPI004059EE00